MKVNFKKIIKGVIGLGAVGGIAYAAYKLGECNGEANEKFRAKYGEDDEDSIESDDDEDEEPLDNYYGSCYEINRDTLSKLRYDEPDDGCIAPLNDSVSASYDDYYPDHHSFRSPVGYDDSCENDDHVFIRLNGIYLDDIPMTTAFRALVAVKNTTSVTNKAIRKATGCSYDTAERLLILFENAGYISEKNNRFRHKVYIKNVPLEKLV